MQFGYEQQFHPDYSWKERLYIRLFGMPIIGLQIRARNIFSLIPSHRKYNRILDAGSGEGVLSFELARRFREAQVFGIDIEDKAVSAASGIAEKIKMENITFQKENIETIKADKGFDLIVCVDILEHIDNDDNAIRQLHSVLSEEGVLVLHVPSLFRRYPIWNKQLNFEVPTHVRSGYVMKDIQEKLSVAGFSIMETGYTYGFFETLANNLSYMITRANKENKLIYALAFPILNLLSMIGQGARPSTLGAGLFIIASKH